MNNRIDVIKNSLEATNSRIMEAEDRISEVGDRMVEIHKYWSGLPFPPPGDLPNPGTGPESPALQAASLPLEPSASSYL